MHRIHRVCVLVAAFIGINAALFAQGTRLSQLERIDTIQNFGDSIRYMPITLFTGEVDHKGQTFTVPGTQSYRTVDSIARHLPLMDYRGDWVATCYEQFDVVVDGCWTMVADTFTCDRPAPQPTGNPYFVSGFGDTPPWVTSQVNATEIISGQRYTWGGDAGYFISARIWVDEVTAGIEYQLMTVIDPLGANPVFDLSGEFSPANVGWLKVGVEPKLVTSGIIFDVVLIKKNTNTFSSFTWNWDYQTPNPQGSIPLTGQIVHPNQNQGFIRVHKFDDGGTDRSVDLATVKSGDLISGVGQTWVIGTATDEGTYYEFSVAPQAQGSPDGVDAFQFTIYGSVLVDYVGVTNHYNTFPAVQGFLSSSGYANIILDQDAYGVDIEIQDATISDEWSLLAYSCSGVIGGGGGGAADGNGMFDPVNEGGTWQVKNWNITGGNSFATQTTSETFGIGLNSANTNTKFTAISGFGPQMTMYNTLAETFTFGIFTGFDAIITSDLVVEIQGEGIDNVARFRGTRVEIGQDIELQEGLIDVNNSLGTAGQILSSTGTATDWIDAAAGGASLWETDPNGIIPIPPVDNIGIGVPSDAAYSLDAGLKMRVRYAVPANDEMLTLASLNTNDAYALYSIGADHFSAGSDNSINRFVISSGQNLNSPLLQADATGVLYLPLYSTGGVVTGTEAGLFSHSPSGVVHSVALGTNGQVLTMNGTNGFTWTTPGGGGGDGIYGGSGTVPASTVADITNPMTFSSSGTATINLNGGGSTSTFTVTGQGLDLNNSSQIRSATLWFLNGPELGLGVSTPFNMPAAQGGNGNLDDVLKSRGAGLSPKWEPPAAAASSIAITNDTLIIYVSSGGVVVDSFKADVNKYDSTVVVYQGEEGGNLNGSIDYPFSIGNGDTHDGNDNYNGWGWHMHSAGRIKRISVGGTGVCNGGGVIEVYINGVATGSLLAINAGNTYAKAVKSILVAEDDVVNFKVTTGCSSGATDWVAFMSVKVSASDF